MFLPLLQSADYYWISICHYLSCSSHMLHYALKRNAFLFCLFGLGALTSGKRLNSYGWEPLTTQSTQYIFNTKYGAFSQRPSYPHHKKKNSSARWQFFKNNPNLFGNTTRHPKPCLRIFFCKTARIS